jgi:hypothetical protein
MEKRKHKAFLKVYNYTMCNQSTKIEHKLKNPSLINGKGFYIHPNKGTYGSVCTVPLILNFDTKSNPAINL